MSTGKIDLKPWNIDCPACHSSRAYQGFSNIECPNVYCKYFSQSQLDLVNKAEKEQERLDEEARNKATASSYVELTDEESSDNNDQGILPYGIPIGPMCDNDNLVKSDNFGYYAPVPTTQNNDDNDNLSSDADDLFGNGCV